MTEETLIIDWSLYPDFNYVTIIVTACSTVQCAKYCFPMSQEIKTPQS